MLTNNKKIDYITAIVAFGAMYYFTDELDKFKLGVCMALGYIFIFLIGMGRKQDIETAELNNLKAEVLSLRQQVVSLEDEIGECARR